MGGRGSRFKTKSNLTNNEKWAVMSYFSSDSYKINEKLYNNENLTKNDLHLITNLDKALKKLPYVKNKKLIRDMSFFSKLQLNEFEKQLKVGAIITTEAYWSTTTDESYLDSPDVRFIINNATKARDMKEIEEKGESEVIYERNSKFKIISKKIIKTKGNYDTIEIELEEL